MRICPSCGRENADNRDFCVCGEYLRWEQTQHLQALKSSAAGAVAPAHEHAHQPRGDPVASPADAEMTLPPGAPAVAGTPPPGPTDLAASAPAVSPGSAPEAPPAQAATLLLRLPDAEEQPTGPVTAGVKPGERLVLLALIRNESGIVDNYDIAVRGLPAGWWTVTPATAYLVPYGTSGNYEQEVQVHVHPPRTPDAQARPWSYEVTAFSRAYQTEVAAAPAVVKIEPYQDVTGKVAPDRAAGRLKARFLLTLRNRANAPAEVLLEAVDAEGACEFRFADPSVTIDPGRGLEAPFTVFPPKQIWIGRPKDYPITVTATPVGAAQSPAGGAAPPSPPLPATYRQRSWLPWWLSIAVPLAAAIAAAVILLMPKQTLVPNLKQAKNTFAAQTLLVKAGLKLSTVATTLAPSAPPGSVIGQTPAAGTKVKKGSSVSIEIAVGSGKVTVPSVVGFTPGTAESQLLAAGLRIGAVSPQPNSNGTIATQIPAARLSVPSGTPVNVFLQPAISGKPARAAPAGAAGAAAAAAAGAGAAHAKGSSTSGSGTAAGGSASGAAGAAGGKPVVIPAVSGSSMAAEQQLSALGLPPTLGEQFSPKPAGTLIGTVPAAGTSVRTGTHVELLVSGGYPQLSYDNGTKISIVGANSQPTATLPPAAVPQDEATWSPDGTHIVFVQGPASAGQLMALAPNQSGAKPAPLTGPGSDDHDPSFAPTTTERLLAFIDDSGGGSRLCFAIVGPNELNPDCTSHPGYTLGRQISWSPDGTKILVFGTKNGSNLSVFGLIEFATNVPWSTQASLWGQGTVVTDTSKPNQGVIAGVFSPNGKRVALISNQGTGAFHVFLTGPDLNLAHSTALPDGACQVAWRPDGERLALMHADSLCASTLGDIIVIDPRQPNVLGTAIATQAARPAWQPLSLGG